MKNLHQIITSLGIVLLTVYMISCDSKPPKHSLAAQTMRGKVIFDKQCTSCHGGKDIAATVDTLKTPVPDLTQINRRRGLKSFPIAEVAQIIDGRRSVKAHGSREMPVWGEVYSEEGMDEESIKGRKGELVAYLMSIQQ